MLTIKDLVSSYNDRISINHRAKHRNLNILKYMCTGNIGEYRLRKIPLQGNILKRNLFPKYRKDNGVRLKYLCNQLNMMSLDDIASEQEQDMMGYNN